MSDDLYAMFLPRFLAATRDRLARARACTTGRVHADMPLVVSALHGIAGDAALLGLEPVAAAARACEAAAHHARATAADADLDALAPRLDELARAIATLESTSATPAPEPT